MNLQLLYALTTLEERAVARLPRFSADVGDDSYVLGVYDKFSGFLMVTSFLPTSLNPIMSR